MKLLICTQKVDINDDLLGFFHTWILEFAKNCEQVTVVCLYQGEYDLPGNVNVLSLGKERGNFRFSIFDFRFIFRIKYFFNFYKYIWLERKNYDAVFVHMNPIYVLLGGIFWRIWKKKIGLWYAHGHAPWELRIAEKFVDNIFTSTASGCRLDSEKIKIVGQGVDVNKFNINSGLLAGMAKFKIQNSKLKLLIIGRIAPIKDFETLIKAVEVLVKKGINVKFDIIGQIGLSGLKAYHESLVELIKNKQLENNINFVGSVPYKDTTEYLQNSDIFISASRTGSLDKVFLEAMACGIPVIGCNEALLTVLGDYQDKLFYPAGDYLGLSKRIEDVIGLSEDDYLKMGRDLRDIVVREHGLKGFVGKIITGLK